MEETEYLLGIADTCPEVLGVVGWIDFEDPADLHHLDRLARHNFFKGVRPMIQDIEDVDWMLRPELDWAFRAVIAHDLAFDALTHPKHLPNFRKLLDRYPGLRVAIDHGSKPDIARQDFGDWAHTIHTHSHPPHPLRNLHPGEATGTNLLGGGGARLGSGSCPGSVKPHHSSSSSRHNIQLLN